MQVLDFALDYGHCMGFPDGSVMKNAPANAGDARDAVSIPEWERFPGGGNGNPLQYSCLESPTDLEEPAKSQI